MQELSRLKKIIDDLNDAPSFQETAQVLTSWAQNLLGCRVALLRVFESAEDAPEAGGGRGTGAGSDSQGWLPVCVAVGTDERFLRDEALVAAEECLCGRVATGAGHADRPFFTEDGSFVWSRMSSFQRDFTPEEVGPIRGRCLREGFESIAIFPLGSAEGPFGSLLVADPRPGMFTEGTEVVEAATHMAGRILKEHRRREQEQQVLEEIQASLLPATPPEVPGLELGVYFTSATTMAHLGGDFYDILDLGDQGVLLLVGDYSGKGIEAAGMAARARYSLERLTHPLQDLSRFLNKANDLLIRELPPERFVSVQLVLVEPQTRRVTTALAGHPPPLILGEDPGKGAPTFREADLQFQPPLGVFPHVRYRTDTWKLEDHDTLLMYTDGVTESRRDGDLFGITGVERAWRETGGADLGRLARAVCTAAEGFHDPQLPPDDRLVLATRPAQPEYPAENITSAHKGERSWLKSTA